MTFVSATNRVAKSVVSTPSAGTWPRYPYALCGSVKMPCPPQVSGGPDADRGTQGQSCLAIFVYKYPETPLRSIFVVLKCRRDLCLIPRSLAPVPRAIYQQRGSIASGTSGAVLFLGPLLHPAQLLFDLTKYVVRAPAKSQAAAVLGHALCCRS